LNLRLLHNVNIAQFTVNSKEKIFYFHTLLAQKLLLQMACQLLGMKNAIARIVPNAMMNKNIIKGDFGVNGDFSQH